MQGYPSRVLLPYEMAITLYSTFLLQCTIAQPLPQVRVSITFSQY